MSGSPGLTTAKQLYEATDLGRCELIEGEVITINPASPRHGRIVFLLSTPVGIYLDAHPIGDAYGAETGFQIASNPDTVRAADLAFVRAERGLDEDAEGFIVGAPDLIAEVLSPSNRNMPEKIASWLEAGVQVAWIVDPDRKTITVHEREHATRVLKMGDTLQCDRLLPGFALPVAKVFAPPRSYRR